MSIILQRRSIRSFSNKLVTDNQIKDIITAGMCAPSAGNQQGWRFIIIKNAIR
ncbi:nitroreductase family protein [Cetobacterium sp. 8H]|uniref:nitroreductase family protein n=1 Tax=Cetobacterium sp. 8H TaxID=2759681 RepID=UPI00163C9C0F|nr:nitroreductase family protein [Cetobacterium sp. 8H]MBC2852168.1 nitroreductase family protein [Cetobacterium sp. 8H]